MSGKSGKTFLNVKTFKPYQREQLDMYISGKTKWAWHLPETKDLSARLWGRKTEFVGFIPQSLALKSIVLVEF